MKSGKTLCPYLTLELFEAVWRTKILCVTFPYTYKQRDIVHDSNESFPLAYAQRNMRLLSIVNRCKYVI